MIMFAGDRSFRGRGRTQESVPGQSGEGKYSACGGLRARSLRGTGRTAGRFHRRHQRRARREPW